MQVPQIPFVPVTQYTHSISISHTTVRLFCSTQGHQLWHHQPTPTQPAHRAPSWNVYMNVTGNTGHIIVSVLLQWDIHVNIFIYSIIFYSIWFDLILFYFIICYPFICLYAHLVCPDFRKARLLTFSTTSNRSYTERDEHTHTRHCYQHTNASVIVLRRTCISITVLRVWFFFVSFLFPFLWTRTRGMQEELRIHKKDDRERLNITIAHSNTQSSLRLACVDAPVSNAPVSKGKKRKESLWKRRRRKREREKRMWRSEEKREGTRALCFILL